LLVILLAPATPRAGSRCTRRCRSWSCSGDSNPRRGGTETIRTPTETASAPRFLRRTAGSSLTNPRPRRS